MSKSEQINSMFSSISPYYDHMNDLMTLGLHRIWKKKVIDLSEIKKGEVLLDLCTGTGDLPLLAAKKVGNEGQVIGIDFCDPMLEVAKQRAAAKKYTQLVFKQGDIQNLSYENESFPAVTISFGLRNTEHPEKVLSEIFRVLKKNGSFICLEATEVRLPLLAFLSRFYTQNMIPFFAKMLGKNKEAYQYLPNSVKHFWSREEMLTQLNKQGFTKIEIYSLLFGAATIYKGRKPGK